MEKVVVHSNYLGKDFETNVKYYERNAETIGIVPHDDLQNIFENIVNHTMGMCATLKVKHSLADNGRYFFVTEITDKQGRTVSDYGESCPESLSSNIGKQNPISMAYMRATDRAIIRYLNLGGSSKLYSDLEFDAGKEYKQVKPDEAGGTGRKTKASATAKGTKDKAVTKAPGKPDVPAATEQEAAHATEIAPAKKPELAAEEKAAKPASAKKADTTGTVSEPVNTTAPAQQEDEAPERVASMLPGLIIKPGRHDEEEGSWTNNELCEKVLRTLLQHGECIIYDSETTGMTKDDRIAQLAAKKLSIGKGLALTCIGEYDQYIKPAIPMKPAATAVNGLTDEFLMDKPTEEEVFPAILDFFGENPEIIIGYNENFDNKFLSAMYARYGKELAPQERLDVYKMARDLVKVTPSYKLEDIAEIYGLQDTYKAHDAMGDVDVTTELLRIFIGQYLKQVKQPEAETPEETATEQEAPKQAATVKKEPAGNLLRPVIVKVQHYNPSHKIQRHYVNFEDAEDIFFDVIKKEWRGKGDIAKYDMTHIEKAVLDMVGAADLDEFSKWKGEAVTAAA